jgi:hypothetical protein
MALGGPLVGLSSRSGVAGARESTCAKDKRRVAANGSRARYFASAESGAQPGGTPVQPEGRQVSGVDLTPNSGDPGAEGIIPIRGDDRA